MHTVLERSALDDLFGVTSLLILYRFSRNTAYATKPCYTPSLLDIMSIFQSDESVFNAPFIIQRLKQQKVKL